MGLGIADALRWQELADDARSVAEQLTDLEAWRTMCAIVQGYERLAERARERERTGEPRTKLQA
jgi:hypothetical protein